MAFHTLTHELSMPHFPDNLQEGASQFAERSSLQPNQDGLRHMLQKDDRERMPDLSEWHASDGLQEIPTTSASREEARDAREMKDKISLVNEGAGSMKLRGPTWLSSAAMRPQAAAQFVNGKEASFLHLQTQPDGASNSSVGKAAPSAQWLSEPMTMVNKVHHSGTAAELGEDVPSGTIMGLSAQQLHVSADNKNQSPLRGRGLLDLHSDTANSSELVDGDASEHGNHTLWQSARLKADILSHPLYQQLLAAHVACLRIATPVDQLPRIDAQLAQSQDILAKYSVLGQNHLLIGDEKDELDQFMTHYVLLLCSFKEQLQQHVRVHAMESIMACWELEQSLLSLTGVSPGEGTGATMSDDEDDQEDSDPGLYDMGLDGHDSGGFGPLIPSETERSLMERVRQELKSELKQGYRDRIADVREEILRKRRAGKLPGDTTSVLKAWWHAHSKWPYPTEDQKARLVQETGLQLKQINNWFINQRKRNWHSNPSSASTLKSKRKR